MEDLTITQSAEKYLDELLGSQEKDTVGIKIFVSEPGTPRAETCIAYAKEDESLDDYLLIDELSFSLFLERNSLDFIKDAVVDYSPDKFGGTLTIKAPNAKLPQIKENASMEEKINYVLYSEINPSLASHGGEVSLVEVLDKETAVLQFGGGCQGCGMAQVTLTQGIEASLREAVPEIGNIIDATDHAAGENPYFASH